MTIYYHVLIPWFQYNRLVMRRTYTPKIRVRSKPAEVGFELGTLSMGLKHLICDALDGSANAAWFISLFVLI